MKIYKVAYQPNLSTELKQRIINTLDTSMWCEDSQLFSLHTIEQTIEVTGKDRKVLNKLIKKKVSYIEL